MSRNGRKELPEASLRVLKRIADQMREGYTGRLELDMNQGGLTSFREIRSIRPADMDASDDATLDIAS